ncbi:sigma 54-interacting transcriptional regulator [Aquimarina sp. U1-2]|uniref:sigma 54-interacting transcriptional regulator n=1 Tax=Aquimarina sp. U1-2 TaxID=2823141 RepID=UPI001AECAD7E|nr:sigma 54-interacting transcriptional regulator [Aquimarina sp. U1-2]MBP2833777.1 sigma 54-interacting transcriptional regulator [Aquimarina sp. U1-2]
MVSKEAKLIQQLQEEIQFKETLLSISEAVASIQNKAHLFTVITQKINTVFPFDELGIFVTDETGQYQRDLSADDKFAYLAPNVSGWLPKDEGIENYMKNGPAIDMLGMLMHKYPNHPHYPVLKENGLVQFIAGPLKTGGVTIGMLCFWSKEEGFYSQEDFPLFQAIADQLAVAVSNVLANEQLLEEKQLTEKLLGISEALVNVSQRDQLFHIITEKIGQLLPMDDLAIVIVNEDKTQWKDISIDRGLNPDAISKELKASGFDQWQEMNHLIEHFISSTEVMNISDYHQYHFPKEFLQILEEDGLIEYIHTPLRLAGNAYGALIFDSKTTGRYSEKDFPLFQAIADQLSVAVSNVLANEQLLEEKQKTENLLAITESIANITTGPELIKAIFNKLRKVFPFDDAGLFHLDYSNNRERDLTVDYGYEVSGINTTHINEGLNGWMPMSQASKVVVQQGILVKGREIYEEFEHPHFKNPKNRIFEQIIAAPLQQGDQTIGLLCFWSKQPHAFDNQLSLFKSITDQMSVALSNILANEAIQLDNKHKKVSLDIAKSIGAIEKLDVLIKETVKTLVPIFKSQEHALIIIDEKRDEYLDLAVIHQEVAGNTLDLKLFEKGFYTKFKIPYKGSQLEEVVVSIEQNNDIPLLFDYNKNYSQYTDKKLLDELRKKLDTCIIGLLKVSGKIVGVFILAYTKDNQFDIGQIELFKSVCDQLALAISNVLAREDIQKREQEKSLQVNLVNTLNLNILWKDKLLQLTQSFSNHLDNHLVIFAFQPERNTEFCHTFERIGANEYRHFDYQKFLNFIGLDEAAYRSNREKINGTLLQTGTVFIKYQKKATVLRKVAKKFNVNSRLTTSLKLSFPGYYRLSFLSKSDLGYSEKDKQLLEIMKPSLELALEKVFALERITELNAQLKQEKNYLREEIKSDHDFENIIGQHISLKNAFEQVRQLAAMDISVLITGETGTGKELIARALHETSVRSEKTLIKMNCAAMPSELIESELFGHEKGAFTGATKQRIGKFELAHESTIFLDEVGELSLEAQAKLLRVLQEKEFERLGGTKTLTSDFRVVAATNRNLQEAIDEGTFRSDLFYRLNGFQIYLPPLRDRLEDAPLLARHFAKTFAHKIGKPFTGFSTQSLLKIQEYTWPGNVRELKNRVEQALVTAKTDLITLQFSDEALSQHSIISNKGTLTDGVTMDYIEQRKNLIEKELITQVLQQTNWRVSGTKGAAKLLGLKATTLEYRMKKLEISKPK